MQKYEYDFAMTCEGCSGAAKRVLGKIGVSECCIEADIPNKKLYVKSDSLSSDEILEAVKKTGKEVSFVKAHDA